eukprot:TRINITY_DN17800_c0_g1_i1.p1 TRINITY_DN17800_c0_g1~~TRINITY_DN17800_c0_g1_i1.p1  ORF type:complete len:412 (+),score=135.00 TRINITY_DN17800_c0_g1_i1:103-1236(+)
MEEDSDKQFSKIAELEEELRRRNAALEREKARLIEEAEKSLRARLSPSSPYRRHREDRSPQHRTTPSRSPKAKTRLFQEYENEDEGQREIGSQDEGAEEKEEDIDWDGGGGGAAAGEEEEEKPSKRRITEEDSRKGTVASAEGKSLESERRSRVNESAVDEIIDEMDAAAMDMPSEAAVRFHRARYIAIKDQYDELMKELSSKDDTIRDFQTKVRGLEDERGRLMKKVAEMEKTGAMASKKVQSSVSELEELRKTNAELERELDTKERALQKGDQEKQLLEVRLRRAAEEMMKFKELLRTARSEGKSVTEDSRKQVDQLRTENRKLERQKNDLLIAFKKQLKLIDILRRQKVHIEAARMLNFTEEELARVLEMGGSK